MNQLRLFEGGKHLEQCPQDPPIDAFEHTFYTGWQIIEKTLGGLALDHKEAVSSDSHDLSSLDNGSGDIHTPIIPILGSSVEVFTEEDMAREIEPDSCK